MYYVYESYKVLFLLFSCNSKYTVYGAQTIPVLDEESTVDVNELMLHETYIALYFIMLLLVVYFLLALAVQTSDRHRLRRRNIWLRDNKLEHEWAYLLTIKTGTQWNAGTTSKVALMSLWNVEHCIHRL